MDVANDNNVKEVVANTVDHFGRIDAIVNNAGFGQIGTLEELTDKEVKSQFRCKCFRLAKRDS